METRRRTFLVDKSLWSLSVMGGGGRGPHHQVSTSRVSNHNATRGLGES